jgi:hypothetical protein
VAATAALKPAAARIDQVLNAFAMWIAMAVTNDNIPVEVDVMIGEPDPRDVETTLDGGNAIVFLQMQPNGRDLPNYVRLNRFRTIYPVYTLAADVARGLVTFSGLIQANLNIHVLGGWPTKDAYYQTTGNEASLAALAIAVNAACVSAGLPGTPTGDTIQFATPVRCNVGGTGSIVRESSRKLERVKAIVLAQSADDEAIPALGLRSAIGHAIISAIGAPLTDNLLLDDGTYEIIRNRGNWFMDKSQSNYAMSEYHLLYELNFGILDVIPATQVGSMTTEITDPNENVINTSIE